MLTSTRLSPRTMCIDGTRRIDCCEASGDGGGRERDLPMFTWKHELWEILLELSAVFYVCSFWNLSIYNVLVG